MGTDRLWKKLEAQRREIEGLQRQLAEERKKVEALVGGELHMLTVHPQAPALVNSTPLPLDASAPPISQSMAFPVAMPGASSVSAQPATVIPLQPSVEIGTQEHTVLPVV